MIRPLLIIWLGLLLLKGVFGFGFSWWWVTGFAAVDVFTFTCGFISQGLKRHGKR